MQPEIQQYPFGSRPAVILPHPDFLDFLGEEGMRRLISRHYDLMRESSIANLFPADVDDFEQAKVNSADFFIQICGGPDYFNQHRGRPLMIRRHAPFRITEQARKTWLECYHQALAELQLPTHLFDSYWNYIHVFSAWMVNTPG